MRVVNGLGVHWSHDKFAGSFWGLLFLVFIVFFNFLLVLYFLDLWLLLLLLFLLLRRTVFLRIRSRLTIDLGVFILTLRASGRKGVCD